MQVCHHCNTSNPAERSFCRNCGTSLEPVTCSSCRQTNEPGDRFCGRCGNALTAQASSAHTPATPTPHAQKIAQALGTLQHLQQGADPATIALFQQTSAQLQQGNKNVIVLGGSGASAGALVRRPDPGPVVPLRAPRTLQSGTMKAVGDSWFGLLFGALFGGIPLAMSVVFLVISILVDPALLLGVLITSIFVLVGGSIFAFSSYRTLRNLNLLKRGVHSRGMITSSTLDYSMRVNGRPATRITWRFQDALGKTYEGSLRSFNDHAIASYSPGTEVAVLYNPKTPTRSVVPGVMGVIFDAPPPTQDVRPALSPSEGAPPEESSPQSLAPAVVRKWKLAEVPRRNRGGCLGGSFESDTQLEFSAQGLTLRSGQRGEPLQILWDQPFSVDLSIWLLPGDELELCVSMIQSSQTQASQVLRFKVELPQAWVDQKIAAQQVVAGYLPRDAFETIWPVAVLYAQTHGQDLLGQIALRKGA